VHPAFCLFATWWSTNADLEPHATHGIDDPHGVYRAEDLAPGKQIIFASDLNSPKASRHDR
jgi:hypothetical protein